MSSIFKQKNNGFEENIRPFNFFYEPFSCSSIPSPRYDWTHIDYPQNPINLVNISISFK